MPTKNWDKEIWEALNKLDVTQYAVRKGTTGFNPLYIPHAVIHKLLQDRYSGFYTRTDNTLEILPDGSGLVSVTITIHGVEKTCNLAVMDHRFKSISPVDARNVADAYQRCFVKCSSLFGLGISLWITGKGEPVDLDPKNAERALLGSTTELSAIVKHIESDNTLVAQIDADVLASAKALLKEGKDSKRMQKASEFLKQQL
jgi:hypothetical protein|tara:strand:+ start:28862 stop:29464 length:603 start_codon:yes stop_codon:yes gene_type:complete